MELPAHPGRQGEVFVPAGYRTQEGDGQPLPAEYEPEPLDAAWAELLGQLQANRARISAAALVAVDAVLRRWRGGAFVGDYAGELWKLDHCPRPWTSEAGVQAVLDALFLRYRQDGYSTKRVGSFEPLLRTLLHLDSPHEYVGRIVGTAQWHRSAGELVPLAFVPILATTIGIQETLIAGGIIVAFVALLGLQIGRASCRESV